MKDVEADEISREKNNVRDLRLEGPKRELNPMNDHCNIRIQLP